MLRRCLILCALASLVAAAPPAGANTVTVTLHLTFGQPLVPAGIDWADCNVSVPAGADGVAVLAAAESSGCIDSYETQSFDFGTFVECIDGICGTPVTYWRMTENGEVTSYGADGFTANHGDVLGFSYTTWLGCMVDEALC